MITDVTEALLPGGLWADDGSLHRQATLRPLTGREEEALAGAGRGACAAAVTDLLSTCLLRLGDIEPVPAELVRRLLVADRDVLLLTLRRITFGDDVRADLVCPWPDCGRPVTVSFALSELPVREPPVRAATHVLELPGSQAGTAGAGPAGTQPCQVTFRLPDGSDQEELSGRALVDPAGALTALLARCVLSIDGEAPGAERLAGLSPAVRARLEMEMQRLAPGLEDVIETSCAECGRTFSAPFDLRHCFFGDLVTDRQLLYREVHHLAFHYHWSEAEIMAMPREKRTTYLDVLSEEIERMNDGT